MRSKLKKALKQLNEAEKVIEEISRTQSIIDAKLTLALPAGKFIPYTEFDALPEMEWIEFWKGTKGIRFPTENPDIMRLYCEYHPTDDTAEEVLPHYHDCVEKIIILEGELIDSETNLPIQKVHIEPDHKMHGFYVKVLTKAIVEFYRPRKEAE